MKVGWDEVRDGDRDEEADEGGTGMRTGMKMGTGTEGQRQDEDKMEMGTGARKGRGIFSVPLGIQPTRGDPWAPGTPQGG